MDSRFGRRAIVTAMVVGLVFSILYGLSGSHHSPGAAVQGQTDIAK